MRQGLPPTKPIPGGLIGDGANRLTSENALSVGSSACCAALNGPVGNVVAETKTHSNQQWKPRQRHHDIKRRPNQIDNRHHPSARKPISLALWLVLMVICELVGVTNRIGSATCSIGGFLAVEHRSLCLAPHPRRDALRFGRRGGGRRRTGRAGARRWWRRRGRRRPQLAGRRHDCR